MCGICGIVDLDGRPANAELVARMSAALSHRGPDGDGFHVTPYCVLGHRRLKIIDLSPLGAQPMSNEDGSVWITFNGEIYNYRELRPELLRHGHRFRSQSDTEVMLHLYEEQGKDFVRQLNGMFALALWDQRCQRLLLARDRFGKKPLYYFADDRRLLFASELKALLADPAVPRELETGALAAYLTLGYVPGPATIFRGIRKLPPASVLVAERGGDGQLRLQGPEIYWQLRYQPDAGLREEECVSRIRELIRDAVRVRLFSDVALGAFLSGGLDSSTVVAMMAGLCDHPVETFSIGFDQASFDELPFAEEIARRFRTKHHTFRCTPDALEVLPTLVHHCDEPIADSSAVPTYYVSKIAREWVTVALSGDGGDEIFAGYSRYDTGMQRWQLAQSLAEPWRRQVFRLLAHVYPKGARGWGILYNRSLDPLDSFLAGITIFHHPQRTMLLTEPMAAKLNGDVIAYARQLAGQAGSSEFLSQMQFVDQMLGLPEDILVKVDRTSMAVSLETRAPLLDYRIAEFLATVPESLRYRGRVKKYLLKQAMAGILPEAILQRGKMGFGIPKKDWFRGKAADFVHDTLLSQAARQRGFFRAQHVQHLLQEHTRGRRDFSGKIWTLLFFELWCQTWLDRGPQANESAAWAAQVATGIRNP